MPPCVKRNLLLWTFLMILPVVAGCGKSTQPSEVRQDVEETATKASEMEAPARVAKSEPAGEPPAVKESPAEDWLIIPGKRVGKITATSSEADLVAAYGAENVQDEEFDLGEGEVEMGTGLFIGNETKELRILWADPEKKANPASIEFYGGKSVWKTANGISLGTPLSKVQEINGKPFTLYGFDWDYGGMVADSNAGAIQGLPHEDPEKGHMPVTLSLRFEPDYDNKPNEKLSQIAGDAEFSSDHPVMQEIDPVVRTIHVSFDEPVE
jgi:hypothetical protein